MTNHPRFPRFADLPITADASLESTWGDFVAGDGIGALHHIKPGYAVGVAKVVRRGACSKAPCRGPVASVSQGTGEGRWRTELFQHTWHNNHR